MSAGFRGPLLKAIAFLVLATVPIWVTNPYYVNIVTQILFWAVFALALNVLVGYAGLTSLGHAGLFGIAGYTAGLMLLAGWGHLAAVIGALCMTLFATAIFAVLALRATGISFLMITLALGQIVWGAVYRWASLTHGDNGVKVMARPMPFGIDLSTPSAFYAATLVVFVLCLLSMRTFVRSPLGASLRGTRDQPRRMTALGYNVWMIRLLAFLFSGFWTGVAGLLFVYYNQFISPQVVGLQTSAEVLLMVISGGVATLLGPLAGAAIVVVMKNVVSAYVERWNLVLGVIFVLIIIFMPEGLVPGSMRLMRGAGRLLRPRAAAAPRGQRRAFGRAGGMSALVVRDLCKSFGGLRVTASANMTVEPGERRLIIGPNGAGKTTLFNQITGELRCDSGTVSMMGHDITRLPARRRAHLGMARTYQIITLFQKDTLIRNVMLSLLSLSPLRWNPLIDLDRRHDLRERAHEALRRVGLSELAERPLSETSYGERRRVEIAMALAQEPKVLLLDEPFAGLSADERQDVKALLLSLPREVTVVMIEHDMDVALDFADRISLLYFGEVIVEGTREEVVGNERTREVYLGH